MCSSDLSPKSNIPKADARANPPEHVRFRIEVSVPEQRGPAFPHAAIKTSHDGASALAPGDVLARKGCIEPDARGGWPTCIFMLTPIQAVAAPPFAIFDRWASRTRISNAFRDPAVHRWQRKNGCVGEALIPSFEVPTLRKSRRVGSLRY